MNFVISLLIFMSGQNKVEEIIMPPMYITSSVKKESPKKIASDAIRIIKQYSIID